MIDRRSFIAASASLALPIAPGARANVRVPAAANVLYGFPSGGIGQDIFEALGAPAARSIGCAASFTSVPGEGSKLATQRVIGGPADGTLLLQAPGTPICLFPHVHRKLGYDPLTDLVPIATMCEVAFAMTVGPAVPVHVKTLDDYARWLNDNPGLTAYGAPAPGTGPHFAGMMVARGRQMPLKPVFYKGTVPMIKDLLAGTLPVAFTLVGQEPQAFASGKLRMLGVTSATRWPSVPDMPTLAEQGLSGFEASEWFGWFAPPGTPGALVEVLARALADHQRQAAAQAFAASHGVKLLATTPAEFAARIRADHQHWGKVVQLTKFTARD